MTTTFEFDMTDIFKLARNFEQAEKVTVRELERGVTEAVGHLLETRPDYPPLPSGGLTRAMRRRRVMRAIKRAGGLEAALRKPSFIRLVAKASGRTGKLGQSLSHWIGRVEGAISEVQPAIGQIIGIWGSALEYAPFVVGEPQAQHMGHWWTLEEVSKAKFPRVKVFIDRALARIKDKLERGT